MFELAASAEELASVDPQGLTDEAVLELIVAAGRAVARLEALRLSAMAVLARRPGVSPSGMLTMTGRELAVAEIAAAVPMSRRAAEDAVKLALGLTREFRATFGALRAGVIDLPRARAVHEEIAAAGPEVSAVERARVEERVLARAGGRTVAQVRYAARRALLSVDPQAAARRHERRVAERCVRVEALPDGMGSVFARLPVDGVAAVDTCLDGLADAFRDHATAHGLDPADHDQRRADAFVGIFRSVLGGTPLPVLPGAPAVRAAGARTAADAPPAEPGRHQPVPHPGTLQGPDALPRADPNTRSNTRSGAGPNARVAVSAGARPGAGTTTRSGAGADSSAGAGASEGSGAGAGASTRSGDGSGAGSGAERVVGWWRPPVLPRQQGRAAHLLVTVAASTLAGTDDQPADLARFGPVPAVVARRLAEQAGTHQAACIDPVTGRCRSIGARTAYRPLQALIDQVMARDRRCRHPHCRRPAGQCDLDHVVPHPRGATCACNLIPLCRFHHRLKHQGGWRVRPLDPDVGAAGPLRWTSRLGRSYDEPAEFLDAPAEGRGLTTARAGSPGHGDAVGWWRS